MTTHLEDRLHIRKLQGMIHTLLDSAPLKGMDDFDLCEASGFEYPCGLDDMRKEAARHRDTVETPRPVVRAYNTETTPHAADAAIAGLKSLHDVVEETEGMQAPHGWDEDPSWRGKLESMTAAERDAYLRSNHFSTPEAPAGSNLGTLGDSAPLTPATDAGPVQPAPKYRNPLESAPPPSAAQEPPAGLPITATYRNYKGEVEDRSIIPMRLYVGTSQWHPEAGWLLEAYDLGKSAIRTFSLKDFEFANLTAIRSLRKAAAFDKLVAACGYVENGTDTALKLYQDDATRQYVVKPSTRGTSTYGIGSTLLQAVEQIELQHE